MHVKTASLATGTVIFVIGELKFGSAAVLWWRQRYCRTQNHNENECINEKFSENKEVDKEKREKKRKKGTKWKSNSNNYFIMWIVFSLWDI